MQPVIIQMIVLLHAAFGCMFLFMYWQHRERFARLMALSWLLEAGRACILLARLDVPDSHHWHSFSDCLNLVATWWLLAACSDLCEVKLAGWVGRTLLGLGVGLVLFFRYAAPVIFERLGGMEPAAAQRLGVQIELSLLFTLVAAVRLVILGWLVRLWRSSQMAGAGMAIIFGVPYIGFALAVPFQFYFNYYPDWLEVLWVGRVLGFSLGMIMLFYDLHGARERERERAYRRIVETSHDLIWAVDESGRWTSVNQATRGIYGYEPEDMLGRPFTDFVAPERVEPDRVAFAQIIAGKALFNFETIHRRKDGTAVNLSFNAVALSDERGRLLGVTGTAQDITERKQAGERARHLANFPELNPNPVLEFGEAGTLAYQNPAAQAMVRRLGHTQLEELLPQEVAAIVTGCLASGQPRLRVVTVHGRHTLSWSFYPILPQRVVHCYIGDITDRMQLEEQLRQAQKMEAVGQLAGGVAHDFNNLLTAIIGHLGLLRDRERLPADMVESLGEIDKAARRAANLTSQLLAFSRLQVVNIRPLDLNEVITQLAKMLRRLLGEHIAVQLEFSSERLHFNGDASMIDQVVVNLAVNARDAMPSGGALRIATGGAVRKNPATDTPPESHVCLTVTDTGTGIPAENIPRIFDPFFTTKEVGKGTGLGLATVFGIIQQHHGWIEVESEVGRGTTFRLWLPRLLGELAPESEPAATAPARVRGRGEVILLVEDEPSVREVGVRALRSHGYRVLPAANGQSALDIWAAHRREITLLLTDVVMPGGITGLQLAHRLQAEKPGLRVIYSSGYNREAAGKELAAAEGVNYLAKPYDLDNLYQMVRETLDSRHSNRPFPGPETTRPL